MIKSTLLEKSVGSPHPSGSPGELNRWKHFALAVFMVMGSYLANATTFTFNNTGCQSVKVYKVFLLFETYQATVSANQSYTTSSASWGEKWIYRSLNGNYLGEYTIPWVSTTTHNFNSGGGPSAPTVGNITHPTCSGLGSITLSGLPSGNWTVTRNPGGVTTTGSGSSTTITGLDAGTYSFSVSQTGCATSPSVNAVLNAAPTPGTAPALFSNTATNACPATTVSLNALTPIFVPSGFSVTWHTGTPATAGNKVPNAGSVGTGTYYATFYNASANCYGGAKTSKVTVTVGNCNGLVRNKNRSLDGSMNNLNSSVAAEFGKSGSAFARELPAAYADGLNTLAGPNRPNPRALSNTLSQELEDDHNDREMSGLFYIWGQFIDHDMTDNRTDAAQPANIPLPAGESIFTNPIAFNRSRVHPGTGTTTPREQTNLNTAWIDASQVYGWTPQHAAWLRSFSKGKLKTSKGDLLPFNTLTGEYDSPIDPTAPRMDDDQGGTKKTFVAGDRRCAEHPGTTSLHTTFLREHNRICDELVAQGMTNDEEIYQRARKIVGAMIQHITYSQWMESMGIQLSAYTGYKPNVHPDILNTFSAAAYRWHTMVENDIILRDNECNGVGQVQLPLRDIFFNIEIVRAYDIGVILKGLSVHRQYETDLKVNGGLRNFLAGNFGSDLVSINIQRGRDHGLPSYNDVRQHYTGTRATSFMDIAGVDSTAQKLASIYNSPDDVDLWVGLYAEPRMPGKSIGKTVNALIVSQFEKLRDGDYYFYKNDPELAGYLNTILATNLDDIISRNSTAGNFQDNVFFRKFCTPEGDDLAKTPCNVISEFTGWTHIGNSNHSKYYRWNGDQMNFADAKELVTDVLAATLPQIKDLTENNQLQGYLGGQEIYLDMVRTGSGSGSSSWRRSPVFNNDDILVQGQSVNYFRWKTGEPNNAGGTEDRVQFKADGRWNDIPGAPLQTVVAELGCDLVNAPCVAGIAAPALTTFTKANTCPSNTVDLSTVTAANKPLNTIITWHTGVVPTNNNKIANITALAAGTYYAAFYSASSNCYSSKTTAYKVTVNTCTLTPSITIADVSVNENAGAATLTIQLSAATTAPVTVQYATAAGTASAATDFVAATGTATIPAGSTTATISVVIVDNNLNEPTELFYVNLTSPNGATLADNQGVVTITDNDAANPCANAGGDSDGDGVCNNNDCQPNNPAFPATPGTACNDGNPNTVNDVVTADGCGCAGTAPGNGTPNCANISIATSYGTITVGGLNGAPITSVQVFSTSWQPLHHCFGNCGGPTASYPVPAGTYYVYVKYYSASYQLICEVTQTVNVSVSIAATLSENLEFNAVKHLEHTELVWAHNGDYDVETYFLERSADGSVFEEVSSQLADGDAKADTYSDFDLAPLTGKNYYRLRLLNMDGTISYSDTKMVVFEDLADYLVFPNPANEFTNIDLESAWGKQVDIHIFNNRGLRMQTFRLDEVNAKYFQMDLRTLHEGHYIIWVNVDGMRPVAKPLVVGRI